MNNYTILMCTYKATDCLKIQYEIFKRFNILDRVRIFENSPRDCNENRMFLTQHHVPFHNNINGKHAQTINFALKCVKTKYALILDEDCFLQFNPSPLFDHMEKQNIQMVGEISCSRGGYVMKPRVSPWFCAVDAEWVNRNNIDFVNMDKVKATDSQRLYLIDEGECRVDSGVKYDVGATFFEDILEKGGRIMDLDDLTKDKHRLYKHIEGCSWRTDEAMCNLMNLNYEQTMQYFNTFQKGSIDTIKGQLSIA